MIGEITLHYKILKKLGEGGMGVVYLAEDLKLERKVAIKFLPKHISGNSEEKERFKIEAKAAAALNHPNIATIYSIEESDDQVFITMEYIKGRELKEIIHKHVGAENFQPLQIDDVINYALQIADGLAAAHKEGITHRDIKPSNIMITEDGKVKIMDFGLAKLSGGPQLTQIGSTIGTVAYMSPEQSQGNEVDKRTDIWSFGVVLYEMLTGKLPFRGDYDQAVIYSILNEDPEFVNDIDEGLKQIISKSLSKKPEARYQTAGEIAEELKTISRGGEIKRTGTRQSKVPWIVTGAAVILIAFALYLFFPSIKINYGTKTIKTIAVLPFANISSNPNQEYISDGLSEELISVLQRNPWLRVTARTSSFSFKGTKTDIKTIAAKLNVNNILEGSVQKAGNNLRISADLVNVETDATLWSDTYDGTIDNIFALQDSISGNVAEALKATLLGKKTAKSEKPPDPKAYNDYLLAKHFYRLRGKKNLEKATGYLEEALKIDPGFARAWVSLSATHTAQADFGYIPVEVGYQKALQEIEKAIELNPNLASAYSQKAWIKLAHDWDWKDADKLIKHALKLEPENSGVISYAAFLDATLGDTKGSIDLLHRSIKLDPVSAAGFINLGLANHNAGHFKESITAFENALELNPVYPSVHMDIALVYLDMGITDSALVELNEETDSIWRNFGLILVNYALGRKKESNDGLTLFIKKYKTVMAFQIAEIYAYCGEKDKAFEWLDRAYNQRDGGLVQLKDNPLLRNIIKDSRYTAFLKKMKLPL